ncbi:MAG TPA: serine hydrolase, partial [Bdellovibrionales bacterium]|nr:serine hydrolase [Bdellovibrionales bacterium]
SRATGKTVEQFANETLFGALGITNYRWTADQKGLAHGGGGLWIAPRDLLKVGRMILDGGKFNGQQVLSAKWIEELSTSRHLVVLGRGYGLQWWRLSRRTDKAERRDDDILAAMGNMSNFLFIDRATNSVIVVNGWITTPRFLENPVRFLRRQILPALDSAQP